MIRKISYMGFPDCFELANGTVSVVAASTFGPRILSYGFEGGENILGWHPQASVETTLGTWRPYGGHRLWQAPENMPRSYAPDNDSIACEAVGENAIVLGALPDAAAVQKQMRITLDAVGSGLTIDHTITNHGDTPREIAAWALTIVRAGGVLIIPNEPFAPYGPETLLPIRTMTLWSYTDFTDPRWSFEKNEIRLRVDETIGTQQKVGVLNRQGWVGYEWESLRFVKRFDFIEGAIYSDMNSNTEAYTAGGFAEVETLSPLKMITPGDSVTHREKWELHRCAD